MNKHKSDAKYSTLYNKLKVYKIKLSKWY